MKANKNTLLLGILLVLLNYAVKAQENYGSDPTRCTQELSTYTEYFKQKNYEDAYTSWSWCLNNCPQSSKNIYIQGTTIIEYFIAKESDVNKKNLWIDTLMMIFDNRIKYFGEEGFVLGRKAISMWKYYPEKTKDIYDVMKRSFQLGKENTEFNILQLIMTFGVSLYVNNVLTKEDVLTDYSKISETLKIQIANESDAAKKAKLEESAKAVEDLFVGSGVADCETVIKMYGPQFEANPDDLELAKKIIMLINMSKTDECTMSDTYMNAAVLMFKNEKSANAAHSLAQSYLKRKDYTNAEKFYNEAINIETDASKKSDMYYELSLVYFTVNNYQASRSAARSALANNSSSGKSYIIIGKIYAITAKNCVESSFERKAVNCLIVDQFIKARNADPSNTRVVQEANELIGRYSAGFPTHEDAFWGTTEINEGDPFSVGCWINESTTIRFSNK